MLTRNVFAPKLECDQQELADGVYLETIRLMDTSLDALKIVQRLFTAFRNTHHYSKSIFLTDFTHTTDSRFNVKVSNMMRAPYRDMFMKNFTDNTISTAYQIETAHDMGDTTRAQVLVDNMFFPLVPAYSDFSAIKDILYYEYAEPLENGLCAKIHCYVRVISGDEEILGMETIHKHLFMQIYKNLYEQQFDLAEVLFYAYEKLFSGLFPANIQSMRNIMDSIPRDDVRVSRIYQCITLLARFVRTGSVVGKSDIARFYYAICKSLSTLYDPLPLSFFRTDNLSPADIANEIAKIYPLLTSPKWSPSREIMYNGYFRNTDPI